MIRYSWRDNNGSIVDSLISLVVKGKADLKLGENSVLKYWPELNCLGQDDLKLLEHIRYQYFFLYFYLPRTR